MDSNKFSHLLHLLYGSVSSGNWQPFLQQVMELTGSNKAFISFRKANEESPLFMNYAVNFDYPAEALLFYQSRPYDDPFFKDYVRFLPEGEIIEPERFMDINEYKETEFSHKVLVPMRSHHVLGALLLRDDEYDAFFVLNRGHDDPSYTMEERKLVELLKPHIQQALRLFTLFRDISQQNDMLKVVLNQSDKALLVLDADASIQLSNQQADTILTTLPYWHCLGNRFRLTQPAEQLRFSALLKQCLQDDVIHQDRLYLQLSAEDPGMQVSLTLAPLHWLQLENGSDNLCLLTITYQHRISWSTVKDEYSLTNRELELVQALQSNQKLTELSEQMGISYHTLRKHLQTIFSKCRVNSQSELMLLLGRFRH